jgi:hypothetical protein
MNDGTFDALRSKIINQLKTNEELRKNTISMVEQSKVLNTPGAENKSRRELFDALRRELETPVLDKASKSVWDLILAKDGLGKEIDDTVERVYRRLSGRGSPVTSSGNAHASLHEENASGSSKKRTFTAMNTNGTSEPANHVHTNTPNIARQTIGASHGNEQAHFSTPGSAPPYMVTPAAVPHMVTPAAAPHMVTSAAPPPHMITPVPGHGHAMNSMNAPWNAGHFKS